MATLRKINGRYFAYFYDPSRRPARKSYPLRVRLKDAAETALKRLEKKWAEGKFDPWNPKRAPSNLTVHKAAELFKEDRAHLRPKSRRAYAIALRGLEAHLPPALMLADLTADHVRPYVEDKKASAETRRHRHRHLRAFFNWCRSEELVEHDPLKGLRVPKAEKRITAFLSPEQLERLLRAIDGHTDIQLAGGHARKGENVWMKDVILLAVGTGLRLGEICAMRWSWIDLSAGFLTVKAEEHPAGFRPKSGNERAVPLAGDALAVVRRLHDEAAARGGVDAEAYVLSMPNGRSLRPSYVSKRFRFFVDEAKLPKAFHFHTLRHTTASWLTMRGVPLAVTQAVLGHSSISVTERYAHLAPDLMKSAMHQAFVTGKFDPWRGDPSESAGNRKSVIRKRRLRRERSAGGSSGASA